MSTYTAVVEWSLEGEFARGRYSRAHVIRFDGGIEIRGSSSPSVVPLPFSVEDAVDPEEMFIAALSSCHMLSFLDIARRAGFMIEHYKDAAEGTMTKGENGRSSITQVVLRPTIAFKGKPPSPAELDALHHEAHDVCFIANSVKTQVRVESV
jgi:organic hydroperoxide reductase OsmC/OhrA